MPSELEKRDDEGCIYFSLGLSLARILCHRVKSDQIQIDFAHIRCRSSSDLFGSEWKELWLGSFAPDVCLARTHFEGFEPAFEQLTGVLARIVRPIIKAIMPTTL